MNPQDQARYMTQLDEVAEVYKGKIKQTKTIGASLPSEATHPKPMRKKKEVSDIMILELRPATPCLYCVGAGEHAKFRQDQGRLFVWFIALFYPVNQKKCGSGQNLQSALSILRSVERQRPDFFVVKPGDILPNDYKWTYLHIFKRYYLKEHPTFSPKVIACDLAWLVAETYEKFRQLPKQ